MSRFARPRFPAASPLALALVAGLVSGCASTLPAEMSAPSLLNANALAQITGERAGCLPPTPAPPARAQSAPDAEAHLVRGVEAPQRCDDPRHGHRYDAEEGFATPGGREHTACLPAPPRVVPPDDNRVDDPARLLDARGVDEHTRRLACVEIQGRREFVAVGSFGGHETESEWAPWQIRGLPPQALAQMRGYLRTVTYADSRQLPLPFESIVAIPSWLLPAGGNLVSLRSAAARVGANAVLVVARSTRVYRYHNALANTYPLVVGLLLPARSEVAVSRVEGAIVDVRTGHVLAVGSHEARAEEQGWLLLRNREDSRAMAERVEQQAQGALARELRQELNLPRDLARLRGAR